MKKSNKIRKQSKEGATIAVRVKTIKAHLFERNMELRDLKSKDYKSSKAELTFRTKVKNIEKYFTPVSDIDEDTTSISLTLNLEEMLTLRVMLDKHIEKLKILEKVKAVKSINNETSSDFIAHLPPETREKLEKLRDLIKAGKAEANQSSKAKSDTDTK